MRQPADSLSQTPLQPEGAPRRRKRKPSGGFECWLGVVIGVSGLAASRLGQLWIAFDVFSQFTLQFAVVAAAFLIGLLMPRAKLLAAFVVLVLGIVGIGAWPHAASRMPILMGEAEQGQRELKVASFNTLWDNEDLTALEAEITRLDADVITLIEMSPAKRRMLADLKALYPHQADCFGIAYCDLVVLSKLPILESGARGQWDGPPFIRVRLGPEAGGLTVLGVHTSRFPHAQAQFRQVTELARLVETLPGLKLVMGDFNATPFSRILSVVSDRGNLSRITVLPSWPTQAGLPQIAIDHIFISPGVSLIEAAQIGEAAGSDHYPVSARIAVPGGP